MSTTLIKDVNVLWDRKTYNHTPEHIRVHLKKCTAPAILLDHQNTIVAANDAWQVQCGYREEAIGASPKILQGDLTDEAKARRFSERAVATGSAGTTLVNYRADGSPFQHTFVADKMEAFFIATTKRCVDLPPARKADSLFAIAASLVLTYFIVHMLTGHVSASASAQVSPSFSSVAAFRLPASAEALPTAALCLLAFFVAALDAAISDGPAEPPSDGKDAEHTLIASLLLALAAFIVAEAPSDNLGDEAAFLKRGLVLLALTATARLLRRGHVGKETHHPDEAL